MVGSREDCLGKEGVANGRICALPPNNQERRVKETGMPSACPRDRYVPATYRSVEDH